MNFLVVAAASLLAVGGVTPARGQSGTESSAIALCRDGIETPLGKVSWDDVVRVRYSQRAAQKNWTFDNGIEVFANASAKSAGGLAPGSVRILKDKQEVYSK